MQQDMESVFQSNTLHPGHHADNTLAHQHHLGLPQTLVVAQTVMLWHGSSFHTALCSLAILTWSPMISCCVLEVAGLLYVLTGCTWVLLIFTKIN